MVDGLQVQVIRDETDARVGAPGAGLGPRQHLARVPHAARRAAWRRWSCCGTTSRNYRRPAGELVGTLKRGTLRLTRLIDNLLESVRIESGQLGIRRSLSRSATSSRGRRLVEGLLSQRGQSLEVALPEDLPDVSAMRRG